jgi:hypothetical protein
MWRGALAAVALASTIPTIGGVTSETACGRFAAVGPVGRVADPAVVEASGLVASDALPGVWWIHNDSGGNPELHAITKTGRNLGVFPIEGATATDWEDLAIGPGPKRRSYLYVGDIGDNAATRSHVTVYRVPEPAARPQGNRAPLRGAVALDLQYPNGPADAEALFVDPRTGDLYVITKGWNAPVSHVLRARSKQLKPGAPITLDEVASIPTDATLVTGAAISPDGALILVRTYRGILAFQRAKRADVASAFVAGGCDAPYQEEPQGEAVAFAANGAAYMTVSEGMHPPIHRFSVKPPAVQR